MTSQEAAIIAVRRFGAPADIARYVWVQLEEGKTGSIPLQHTDVTTHGELRLGWDPDLRFAVYAWKPSSILGRE
jgi:hypothetical protein